MVQTMPRDKDHGNDNVGDAARPTPTLSMSDGDAFAREFGPGQDSANTSRLQLQQDEIQTDVLPVRRECGCCHPGCTFDGLATTGTHRCRSTLSWTHAPCCVEVKVDLKWVTVADTALPYANQKFPASLRPADCRAVNNHDSGWDCSFSQICLGCLPGLLERGITMHGPVNEMPSAGSRGDTQERTGTAVPPSAKDLALYSVVYPDEDPSILNSITAADMEEVLTQTKQGYVGSEHQRAYELGTNNSNQPNTKSARASERLKAIQNKFTTEGLRRNSKAEA